MREFLFGTEWKGDVYSSKAGFICKISYDSYRDLIDLSPLTASRLYRRIVRHYSFDIIQQKRRESKTRAFSLLQAREDDLFVEIQYDVAHDSAAERFLSQSAKKTSIAEFVHPPLFLCESYRMVLESHNEEREAAAAKGQDALMPVKVLTKNFFLST